MIDDIEIPENFTWDYEMKIPNTWIELSMEEYELIPEWISEIYFQFIKFYCGKASFVSDNPSGWLDRWNKWLSTTNMSRYRGAFKKNLKNNEEKQKMTMNDRINDLNESEEIKKIRHRILEKIGSAEYYSWFHLAKIETVNSIINFTAHNNFAFQKWENSYPWALKGKI